MPPTQCDRAPAPPTIDADDKDWALFKAMDHKAGADCRDKLDEVNRTVNAWPRDAYKLIPKEN